MCKITEELKREIWNKGSIVEGYDPDAIRKDSCGAWILYDKFNSHDSIFGWEIDHIYPLKKLRERNIPDNVIDNVENLRPLNWLNNQSKGADYPCYHGSVTANGDKNERGDYQFEVGKELQKTLESLFGEYI